MPTAAREYVCGLDLRDFEKCRELMTGLVASIQCLNATRRRANFHCGVLRTPEDIADEGLEPAEAIAFVTEHLPCVWVNITYDPNQVTPAEIERIERAFNLRLLATASSKLDYF